MAAAKLRLGRFFWISTMNSDDDDEEDEEGLLSLLLMLFLLGDDDDDLNSAMDRTAFAVSCCC